MGGADATHQILVALAIGFFFYVAMPIAAVMVSFLLMIFMFFILGKFPGPKSATFI